jgi:hypothetical protein
MCGMGREGIDSGFPDVCEGVAESVDEVRRESDDLAMGRLGTLWSIVGVMLGVIRKLRMGAL